MKQSKATIRAWIPVLDKCIENWKKTVKDGKERNCPACKAFTDGQVWAIAKYGCHCPLDTPNNGCCDGNFADWECTQSALDAKRVLAYIRKIRKQLAEELSARRYGRWRYSA